MPRTTTDPNVRIPKPPRDPADVKAQARATADRAKRRGDDWTTAYIRAWRRLSGLPTRRSRVA